jgi:hypothetical protein
MRACLVAALLLAASPAAAYDDPATGFAFRAPPGVVESPSTRVRFDAAFALDSATGQPPSAGTGKHLCEATFKRAAANARLTQGAINALATRPARKKRVRETLALAFEVTAMRAESLGEVLGLEIEARPTHGPGHEDARAYLTIHETPKGRVTLVCVTTKAAWEAALPLFREIRGGLIPPK